MTDTKTIPEVNLSNPEFLKFMEESFVNSRNYDSVPEAKQISDYLGRILDKESSLQKTNPDMYAAYQDLITKFRFVAMPVLDQEEVEKLMSDHILVGLSIPEFELKRSFDGFLLTITDELKMIEFYDRIERDLRQSSLKIGNTELETQSGSKPPTIQNWLGEYLREARGAKERGSFELVNFMTHNKNISKLDDSQKDLLRKVLDFYDWLEFPREYETKEKIDPELERTLKWVAEHADEVVQSVLDAEGQGESKGAAAPVSNKEPAAPPESLPKADPNIGLDLRKRTEGNGPIDLGPQVAPAPKVPEPKSVEPEAKEPKKDQGSVNEELYRSTLNDLKERRKEFEQRSNVKPVSSHQVTPPPSVRPLSPEQEKEIYERTAADLRRLKKNVPPAPPRQKQEEQEVPKKNLPPPPLPRQDYDAGSEDHPTSPAGFYSINESLVHAGHDEEKKDNKLEVKEQDEEENKEK